MGYNMENGNDSSTTPPPYRPTTHIEFYVGTPPQARRVDLPIATALASTNITTHILPKASRITARIHDLDPSAFEDYARFLMHVKPRTGSAVSVPSGHPFERTFTWKECQKFITRYIFGAEAHDKEYQNYVLQELVKWLQPSQHPDFEILDYVMQEVDEDDELMVFVLERMFGSTEGEDEGMQVSEEEKKESNQGDKGTNQIEQAQHQFLPSPGTQFHRDGGEETSRPRRTQRQSMPASNSTWRPPTSWGVSGDDNSITTMTPGEKNRSTRSTSAGHKDNNGFPAPEPKSEHRTSWQARLANLKSMKGSARSKRTSGDHTGRHSHRDSFLPKAGHIGRNILSAAHCGTGSHATSSSEEPKVSKSMPDLRKTHYQTELRRGEGDVHRNLPRTSRAKPTRRFPVSQSLPSVVPKSSVNGESKHAPVPRLRASDSELKARPATKRR